MSNPIKEHLNKLAAEHYDLALEHGEPFTVDDVVGELGSDLLARFADDHSVTRDLILMTARSLVQQVDRSRTSPRSDSPSLFNDLDRPVPVAKGQRIARRHMRQRDWSAHLEHVSDNASRVSASASREYARHAALSPYLAEGLTTEQSVERWQADNPDEVLP